MNDQFLSLLPCIEKYASYAFRYLDTEARSEAIADVVANAWVAFSRLLELGKAALAYPTTLAMYAVAQFKEGRRVGTPTNTRDVASPAAKRKHGHEIESLNSYRDDESWKSVVVEDRRTGPAELVAFRLDFSDWLDLLPVRQAEIVSKFAEGYSTSELAETFKVSRGRISQLRRELEASWCEFLTT